jgi:protein ImuB
MERSGSTKSPPDNFERIPPPPPAGRRGAERVIAAKSVQEIFLILRKWGINTIGQFATLDKEELAARLGPQALRLWERANGISNRLLKFVQPPESFEESFEFENEIETAEPLLFMLRRFLEQLALRLSAIYLVAKEITLRITFASKQHYERLFKIPQPTNDVDLLYRMLQTHLENFKSEHPIVAIALIAEPIKPAFRQFGLFETALRNPQQLYETLAHLTAFLGTDRVGTPVLEETHRPEAFRMELFAWRAVESADRSGKPLDALRTAHTTIALRRFRPPVAASIFSSEHRLASRPRGSHFDEVAGSPSSFYLAGDEERVISLEGAARLSRVWRHLQSEDIGGKVIDQRGPYLLSGNWWDEKVWARGEWDLQLENGSLVRAHESEGTWKVDGIYD